MLYLGHRQPQTLTEDYRSKAPFTTTPYHPNQKDNPPPMPLFISKQAEKDYWKLRHTMYRAEFKNDRPLIDWCERYLALFRPVREIRTAILLPHHRKLDFEDLIPKQPPLITNAAWLLPEDFKKKYWKTYPTKRK